MLDSIIAGCGALGKTKESYHSAETESQTFPSEAFLALRASQREAGVPYAHSGGECKAAGREWDDGSEGARQLTDARPTAQSPAEYRREDSPAAPEPAPRASISPPMTE